MTVTIIGTVEYGRQEASKIGFNTLNIHGPVDIINKGIFYGVTTVENIVYRSVIYVGNNRTDGNNIYQCIESHLIDIKNVDYYGELCKIQIIKKIRD